MISKKSTFYLGLFIFVIPFLGLPSVWKTFFILLSGIVLVFLSIKIILPKKNTRPRARREKVTPVFVESVPAYDGESKPKSVSDEYLENKS